MHSSIEGYMGVQLLFTIRRGLPNTIDTREESRHSSRSQGFSTQHEKCPLRWLSIGVGLGMGEEGKSLEMDLDGSSTHSFAPWVSSPRSASSRRLGGEAKSLPRAKAKRQSQEPEPRAFVPLRRGANRVALFFTHTHISPTCTYTLMHTHWCICILRRTSDVEMWNFLC